MEAINALEEGNSERLVSELQDQINEIQKSDPNGKKKIGIVYTILTASGFVRAEHYTFFHDLVARSSQDPNFPFFFALSIVQDAKPAVYAHNIAANQFMKMPMFDWMWIMADDMVPNLTLMYQLEELLNTDADMIGCSVRIWNSKDKIIAMVNGKKLSERKYRFSDFQEQEEPFYTDANGTGGLLIHRRVFEDPRMKICDEIDSEHPAAWFMDEYAQCGYREHGHDLQFTDKAVTLGYKILCVPAAICGHIKAIDLNDAGDYAVKVCRGIKNENVKILTAWAVQNLDPDKAAELQSLMNGDEFSSAREELESEK